MTDESSIPDPPDDLPSDLSEVLEAHATDAHGLQETVIYAQELLNALHESIVSIEPKEDEEIVRVTDRDGYTEVVKRFRGQPDAYLYHVQRVPTPDDDGRLRWTLIGRVAPEENA